MERPIRKAGRPARRVPSAVARRASFAPPGAHHENIEKTITSVIARERIGWLRAAVLGANDGIVSTASLILGVAAASASHASVLIAGVAGLVAGAMSMAAGEYVSVHSQADTESADLERERASSKPTRG